MVCIKTVRKIEYKGGFSMKKLILALLIGVLLCSCACAERIGDCLQVVNCNEWITLRQYPSTKAYALGRLYFGDDNVVLLNDEDYGDFVEVAYGDQTGYALREYLKPVQCFAGETLSLNKKQRYNVNLFLSNFSEQDFMQSGAYERYLTDNYYKQCFAYSHILMNKEDSVEYGDWYEYNVRIPLRTLQSTAKKYLNLDVDFCSGNPCDGDYVYFQETGGDVNGGYVCYDTVEKIDSNRLSVYFHIYGSNGSWTNEVCYSKPIEINDWFYAKGHALINMNGSGLNNRSGWYLERYAVQMF